MLCPKQTRYRKFQKGRSPRAPFPIDLLQFGRYGLKSGKTGILKSNTVEAVRRVLTRKLKRNGLLWIRIFPDKRRSEKPVATRMGKGKGSPSYWYSSVSAGQILFEMDGIPVSVAKGAVLSAAGKLPLKVSFVN